LAGFFFDRLAFEKMIGVGFMKKGNLGALIPSKGGKS
jgi:hypothetical protein